MAEKSIGKITQVISAVLDIKFPQGGLPEINDAIEITRKDGGTLVVEDVYKRQRWCYLRPRGSRC